METTLVGFSYDEKSENMVTWKEKEPISLRLRNVSRKEC